MPEVQNVGAVDAVQYQQPQYQQDAYAGDYSTQLPDVYDENYAQMQAANKSRIGATLLSAAIAVGIGACGYFIGKSRGGKGTDAVDKVSETVKKELDAVKKELEDIKNSEAVKNYDKLKEATDEIAKMADEKKVYLKVWINGAKKFRDRIRELLKPFKADAEKVAEETKDKVKDVKADAKAVAEDTKDAAKELEEKATDSNK